MITTMITMTTTMIMVIYSDDDDAIAGDDGTVESLSTDTRIYRTVSFAPTKTPYVFFNMDNGHFPTSLLSRKLSHLINPALQRTMVS